MKIKCLIVDDEELAQDIIENYIATIPSLELIGKCDNAIEAISFLHENPVDLIFLDLNMPELSGLDMLKTLNNAPKVILTTAYSEYALESYEYGVVDYLLKPIKLERFIKAVNKAVELIQKPLDKNTQNNKIEKSILIKHEQTNYRINSKDIIYIESYGNYLKIHTEEKTYIIRETMQNMEEELKGLNFLRIHKSYCANLNFIKKIEGNIVYIHNASISVGTTYKNELLKKLQS